MEKCESKESKYCSCLYYSANAFASKQFVESQPNASEISSFWIGGYSKANTNYAL